MSDAKRAIDVGLQRDPAEVRAAILAEHAHVRGLFLRVEEAARRLASSRPPHELERVATVEVVRLLCTVMSAHIRLEERALAPALERLDAWGKVRADRLRVEHASQLQMLRSYLTALDHVSASEPAVLAQVAHKLVNTLRVDMEIEERTLLTAELWRDDPAGAGVETG